MNVAFSSGALIGAGVFFHRRGWLPATSGNLSVRLDAGRFLITRSGVHKGELEPCDLLEVDSEGRVIAGQGRASYETGLHLQIYRRLPAVGAVLHVHSVADTVLSRNADELVLRGYELQKALPGAAAPESSVQLPVFENEQDITRLSRMVDDYMQSHPQLPAYLIAGHGLYAWGADVAQARHRVEALEFMLACELEQRRIDHE